MNIRIKSHPADTARILAGRVALVTGSTSGIGLGVARALAAAGAHVMLNGFGAADEIARTRDAIESEHSVRARYSAADMSSPSAIGEMVAFLASEVSGSITGTALPVDGGWTAH